MKKHAVPQGKFGPLPGLLRPMCLILIIGLSFACKKRPQPGPETETDTRPLHGKVIGELTQKTIGAAGGELITPDANIKLVVPEGALDANVNISVQEVTSTIGKSGIGKTYRLLPENVQFKKDVELSIAYTDDDYLGTRRELLYMGYQTADGKWHKARESTFSATSNLVSVKTKHFSDWGIWSALKIVPEPDKEDLFAKETAKFEVIVQDPPSDEEGSDLIAPAYDGPTKVRKWDRSGLGIQSGTIVGDGNKATYTAPDVVQGGGANIQIVAYMDMSKIKWDSKRAYPDYAYFIPAGIKILPDEYMYWGHSRQGATFAQTISATIGDHGEISMTGRYNPGQTYAQYFKVYCAKPTVGRHVFGKSDDTYVNHGVANFTLTSIYSCNSVEKYSLGQVMITKVENGYVTGYVQGTLQYAHKPCTEYEIENKVAFFRIQVE